MHMPVEPGLASAILAEIPRMRAYARLMTNDRSEADREVEEALNSVLADDICWSGGAQLRVELLINLRSFLARIAARRSFKGSVTHMASFAVHSPQLAGRTPGTERWQTSAQRSCC